MSGFSTNDGNALVMALVKTIQENKEYLGEIDGAIGDGDHGINMNKGFTFYAERHGGEPADVPTAFKNLSQILMGEIGGSMGPIYGKFFRGLFRAAKGHEVIDAKVFYQMLKDGMEGVREIGGAGVGDKTLMDTLIPAVEAYDRALAAGKDFKGCLEDMKAAGKTGWESTKDMQAKIGRASRLGERSIGVLDAGATSCWLILQSLANAIEKRLA